MVIRITELAARGALGKILEEIRTRGDSYVIERDGRRIAVLVPAEEYERLSARRAERFRIYERIKARTRNIPRAKLDRVLREAVRAARGTR